jgi:hypothetical protein
LGNKVVSISSEIFEVTGTKIVDHRQSRFGKFFLQRQGEIGADESGPSGDN